MSKENMIYAKLVMQGIKPTNDMMMEIAKSNNAKTCFKAMMQVARMKESNRI